MIQTAQWKGKTFALECECKERGGHKWRDRLAKFGFDSMECPIGFCDTCEKSPWIILPIRGNNEDSKRD
jgi:hypothetical protein